MKSPFLKCLTVGICGICFLYLFLITFMPIPEANQRHADTILINRLIIVLTLSLHLWYSYKWNGCQTT